MPCCRSWRSWRVRIDSPLNCNKHLGTEAVYGRSLDPLPAARMMALIEGTPGLSRGYQGADRDPAVASAPSRRPLYNSASPHHHLSGNTIDPRTTCGLCVTIEHFSHTNCTCHIEFRTANSHVRGNA